MSCDSTHLQSWAERAKRNVIFPKFGTEYGGVVWGVQVAQVNTAYPYIILLLLLKNILGLLGLVNEINDLERAKFCFLAKINLDTLHWRASIWSANGRISMKYP